MEKLKTFFFKLGEFFKTNPIVSITSVGNLAYSSAFGYVTYLAFAQFGWSVPEWAMYLIIAVASTLQACLIEWGIVCKGLETVEEKAKRLAEKAEAKAKAEEEARLEAEAQAKIDAEAKEEAKLLAEAQARIDAEAQAKAEAEARKQAEQAQKEYEQKVAAKVAELKAAQAQKNAINFQNLLKR